MSYSLDELLRPVATAPRGLLPEGVVLAEAATASLRAWLDARDAFADYEIFAVTLNIADVETHAADGAPWEPLPPLCVDGSVGLSSLIDKGDGTVTCDSVGVLPLLSHEVVIARWTWIDVRSGARPTLMLAAAPSAEVVGKMIEHVRQLARVSSLASWQIYRDGYVEETPPRPALPRDSVVLEDALAERLEREVVGFFAPAVAKMYAALGVPHRRGVLMYGPPGNGKTSTIRYLGGRLPEVAAVILRPEASFTSDTLDCAIAMWTRQAPAMLVIEDLNWILERVNVSTFLNALDGVDTPDAAGGLLLIASTNHPELLDPALSNRPGRFDVVFEVPLPTEPLRLRYLREHLPTIDEPTLRQLAAESEGLSFAYLGELLRMSGLAVIANGRIERTREDLFEALASIRQTSTNADRGFVSVPEFGLQTLVRSRE